MIVFIYKWREKYVFLTVPLRPASATCYAPAYYMYNMQERSITAAQLSLAWVSSQGSDVVPIPGTTKIKNLLSNVAAQSVELTPDECEQIAAAVPHEQVVGERYSGGDAAIWKGNA
jgi:diketogulonate reductase-like aldo/keto reductase